MVRCLFVLSCLVISCVMGKTIGKSPIDYAPFRYVEKTDLEAHPMETVIAILIIYNA